MLKIKKYYKVRDYCHYTEECRCAAYSICNLKYSITKEISVVFHNGSNHGSIYNYYFIIKELAEEFEQQFTCLGESTEKHINLLFLIQK